MSIDTAKVQGRRTLQFSSLDDILADIERLNQGKVRGLGNWSPGQVLKHLTILMTASLDGFRHRAPWFIRLVGKVMKRRLLTKPMSAGFQLPAKAAAELGPPPTEWADGVRQFRDVDQPCAALVKDLKQRGLLDDTLIIWGGEFGRTPMGQGTGRDHHIQAFSIWLAGGGVKGGASYGSTDENLYCIGKR